MIGIYTRLILKESVKNMQEYRKPPCRMIKDNLVGSGGNGTVYVAMDSELVCKIFSADKKLPRDKVEKRYERFCNEILVQKELATKMEGVLPIVDYCVPDKYDEEMPAWFTMPKAYVFPFMNNRKDISSKIVDLIELGEIISELHSNNRAHRDIKPGNILIFDNRIILSDYGLVWTEGENWLTNEPERIGPIKILPPELERCEDLNGCDYKKSDVYLFSKVAWMYIKVDNNGFKGPYNRGSSQIYLDSKKYNCACLEPFHMMMEEATKEDWHKRSGITDCIRYLRIQRAIICGEISEEELKNYILKEKTSYFEANVHPDYKVYSTPDRLAGLLDSLIPVTQFEFKCGIDSYNIKPKKYRFLSDSAILFTEELPNRRNYQVILNIYTAEIHEKIIVLNTAPLSKEDNEKYNNGQYHIISAVTKAEIKRPTKESEFIATPLLTPLSPANHHPPMAIDS